MDSVKIGRFLSELRREAGYTQEELGTRLGVSDKTISRWERGVYLPPTDVLKALADCFHVSADEILTGERRRHAEAMEHPAQEKPKAASLFSVQEKQLYYRRKWRREHRMQIALCILAVLAMFILALFREERPLYLGGLAIAGIVIRAYFSNAMQAYVERHIYD